MIWCLFNKPYNTPGKTGVLFFWKINKWWYNVGKGVPSMKKTISFVILFLSLIIPCFSIPNITLFEDNEPFFIIKYPKIYYYDEEDDYA